MDGGGEAVLTMWSIDFSKNPLDFVSNSSSFASNPPHLDERILGANLNSGDIGWATLGNQSRLDIEVVHLLSLPEDAEVCTHLILILGCWRPLDPKSD